MDTNQLTRLFKYFAHNEFFRNYIYKYLDNAEVLEAGDRHEIRIPVDGSSSEESLIKAFPEIRRKLRDPDYRGLLPVEFTFVRKDGTMITEAWEERHEALLKSVGNDPTEFSIHSIEAVSPSYYRFFHNRPLSAIINLLNDNSADSAVRKYNCEFKLILKEMLKTIEGEPSFARADQLLSAVETPLNIIEKALGRDSEYVKYISELIVDCYLTLLKDIVNRNQTTSNLEEADKRDGQLYSYAIDDYLSRTIFQAGQDWREIRQMRKNQVDAEKASLLSERIKSFALDHSSVKGYTSPGWAVLVLIVLSFASWVAIFEKIGSLFKKKRR